MSNRIIKIMLLFLLSVNFIFLGCSNKKQTYDDYISALSPVTYQQMLEKADISEEYIVYIGRESCPSCQVFAKILYDIRTENDLHIYYWDLKNLNKNSEEYIFLEEIDVDAIPALVKHSKSGYQQLIKPNTPITKKLLLKILCP